MDDVVLNLVESWDEAQSFMSWLGERRQILACDTETGGLDWWKDRLRLVQFGDLNTGWAIPWERWGGLADEALRRYNGPLVFHNAKFDVKYLEQNGVAVKRHLVEDTRTMAHLIDPANNTGLKELGVRYVSADADAGQQVMKKGMLKNRWTWDTVPVNFPPYWMYSALDPVLTARLYQLFKPQIIGDQSDLYEMELQVIWILNEIEKKGARVDLEYCIQQRDVIAASASEWHEWILSEYGVGSGQNPKIAEVLQEAGIKLTKRTGKSGAYSMDEDVLSGIDHPLAQAVLNVRKLKRTSKAYFGKYVDRAVGDILHPDINPLGARTGRQSVSNPPLQQIPRSKLLRDPFIPREGNKLVTVDYDQLEFRLLADLCQDRGMIEAFASDDDFFATMASQAYGRVITKKEPERGVMKNTMYGIAYGAGQEKSAVMTGLPEEEMAVFRAKVDHAFPGLKTYMKSMHAMADKNAGKDGVPFVKTPMGRRQPADWFKEQWKYYALLNYQIQGAAADVFKTALVEMDKAGLTELMILPVHDEIVLDVPAHEAEEVAQLTVECFEADDQWTVPLTAGHDIVDRWGDKYQEDAA